MPEKDNFSPEITRTELSPQELLSQILDTQRIPSPEYQSLIQEQEGRTAESRHLPDNFADHWLNDLQNNDILNDRLRNHLAGKVLVDLGGGRGTMDSIAHKFAVTTYINVERAPFDETEALSPTTPIEHRREDNLLSLRIHADMLDFVSRLKDGSVDSFVINGIDTFVIDRPEYHNALAKEILRATKKTGLIFGRSSSVLEDMKSHVEALEDAKQPVDLPVHLMEPIRFSSGIFFEKTE